MPDAAGHASGSANCGSDRRRPSAGHARRRSTDPDLSADNSGPYGSPRHWTDAGAIAGFCRVGSDRRPRKLQRNRKITGAGRANGSIWNSRAPYQADALRGFGTAQAATGASRLRQHRKCRAVANPLKSACDRREQLPNMTRPECCPVRATDFSTDAANTAAARRGTARER